MAMDEERGEGMRCEGTMARWKGNSMKKKMGTWSGGEG